ncbi:MAG: M56 family metallopeptidase [Oscillospiraceae bacterium]|nr:M56 family metallopeptidase [Oscillospiraceae bacterium]
MLETIITSSVLIIALLLLRAALKGRISSRLRYGLWLAVVVRLLLPFPLTESSISVMNLFTPEENPAASATAAISGILPDTANTPEANADNAVPVIASRNDLSNMPQIPDNSGIDDNSNTLGITISRFDTENSDTYGTPTDEEIAEAYFSAVAENPNYANTPLISENTPTAPNENIPDNSDTHSDLSYTKIIIGIWAAVAAAGLLWFGGVNIAFGKKLRKYRREVNCASPLPVYRADFLKSPCLFGKAVYINEQPPKHLKYIIAHEYSHYCHGDHIWSAVRQILLCVYWFNPLVWAAAIISKNDCECACDEAAMELIGENDRTEYGRALLEMIPSKGGNIGIAATSMSGRGRALAERLRLIAAKPLSKRSAKVIAAKTAAVLVALIACGCTFTTSQSLEQDNDNIIADNGIAVTPESPAPAHNERQYQVNAANRSYETYLHTYDNYKEFYENHAAEVYADSLTINPEEFGEFSAFFNLWIKYRNKTMATVRINYSPEDEKFYADEPFEVGYFPEFAEDYLTLLPDKPYEEVIADSWEDYLKRNYPCDLYDVKLFDEPVEEVWIIDPIKNSEHPEYAGFIMKSKNYLWDNPLCYFPDNVYPDEKWAHPRGTGFPPSKIEDDTDFAAEGYTLAQTREEYYSRQQYHPSDVLHSFKKQVPLSDGSGTVTRTVQLVMTREDYPNGLPNLNYELQGDFALRILDSEGNITGECPIDTAAVDVKGDTSVTVNDMYLSRYFKYSKNSDRLLVFSVPSGYHDGGWHNYTAFFGITDEGELFRYHIDKGEFDYPAYMGGDELFTGDLYSNSRLYSESGAMVNKGEHYMVNIERQRNGEENLNIILFDESAHLIKNACTISGYYNEELMRGARDVTHEKYNYLFMRHIDSTWGETPPEPDFSNFDNIVFGGDNWQDYVNMPMGDITDRDLFYALSAEAEERHPGVEDMIPFWQHGDKEYVVHFNSDYMGEAWEYAADAVMAEETEDGSYYVYYVSFGCDYYSVCRYKAEKSEDKWVLSEFERII